MEREEDGPLGAVVRPQDLNLFNLNACLMMLLPSSVEQAITRFVHTIVSRDERVRLSGLLV